MLSSMIRIRWTGVFALLIAVSAGSSPSIGATEPPSTGLGRWPSGDELRASLVSLGYSFHRGDPESPWPGPDLWTGGRPDIPGSFAWPAERSVGVAASDDAPATARLLVGGDARLIELLDVGSSVGVATELLLEVSDRVRDAASRAPTGGCTFATWPVTGGRVVLWQAGDRDSADLEVAFAPLQDDRAVEPRSGSSGPHDGIPVSAEEACGATGDDVTGEGVLRQPSSSSAGAPTTVVAVEAREFAFSPAVLTIPASGAVEIVVHDAGRIVHNFTVDPLGIQVVVSPGGSGQVTVLDATPGTYQFYCSISGHKEAGMVGTLIVE